MQEQIIIKEPQGKLKRFLYDVLDILAFLVFIFGVFLFIKVFIVAPVVVKWHSMLPNYKPGEYIFIDKFYRKLSGGIKRWDVVVVMPPDSNVSFLKRVVGLSGETIEIKSGSVYLCKTFQSWQKYTWKDYYPAKMYKDGNLICKQLNEPYIAGKTVNLYGQQEKITTTAKCNINKFVLWSWHYLVFGDDRMYSTDSRCCFRWFCLWTGDTYYITKDEILGKVWWVKIGF